MAITTSAPRPRDIPPPAPGPAGRERTDWLGIAFGLALGSLAGYHQFKLPPALPVMLRTYGFDETFAGALMSVYAVIGMLFSGAIGAWQSRQGMAPFLHVALALLAAGNVVGLMAPESPPLLLLGRAAEAAGFAILAINCPLLCARHASPRHRMIAVAIGATWIPVGQLCAIALGAATLPAGDWQALWWGGLVACAAFAALAVALSRRLDLSPPQAPGRNRLDAADRGRRAAVVLTATLFMLWSTQLIAYFTWLPEVLVSAFALDAAQAAVAYAVPVATVLAFNLAGGWLLRHGAAVAPLLAVSLALQLAVWVALPWTQTDWTGVVSLLVYGAGAGVTPTCLYALPSLLFGHRPPSSAFATLMTGRSLGVLVGPLLLAQAFALTGDWNVASPIFAVASALAVTGAVVLHRRLQRLGLGRHHHGG